MANNSIFTEEEKAEDKKDALEMLKLGTPYSVISDELGRSVNYIVSIKQILIANGEITQDEIDKARVEYRRNRIEKQMLSKPKKEEKLNSRTKIKIKNKQIILEMFKQGYSQAEIAKKLEVSESYVQNHKDELIREGKLEKSEIKRATPQYEENSIIREKYSLQVLKMLKKGVQKFIIRNILHLSTNQMEVVLEEIRRKKLITKEEYEEAIKKKEEKDIKFVEQSVKKGYSIKDMIEQDPTLYKSEITRMVKQLIEEGKITREQVEENKLRKFKETRNSGSEMTVKKQEDFVFKFASKGYTPREIADLDKTNSIDFNKATRIKKDLIKRGILNSTEVNEAIKNRKEEAVRKRHDADMDKIIKYTKEGFSEFEIAGFLGYSKRHIAELKTEYREKNGWFSKEELESFKKARLERKEKERLKQEERERKKAQKEQKEKEKNESLLRRYEIYRKRVVRGYDEYIKGKTKKADMFRDYLEILIEMEEKNLEVDVSDIRKASIIVADCTELATKRYLKYIIIQHYKYYGEESTIAYINRVIRENEEDENKQDLREKLQKYKNVIHELNLKEKINQMIHQGEKINDISKELGVTYQYVVELYKKEINTEIDQR